MLICVLLRPHPMYRISAVYNKTPLATFSLIVRTRKLQVEKTFVNRIKLEINSKYTGLQRVMLPQKQKYNFSSLLTPYTPPPPPFCVIIQFTLVLQ